MRVGLLARFFVPFRLSTLAFRLGFPVAIFPVRAVVISDGASCLSSLCSLQTLKLSPSTRRIGLPPRQRGSPPSFLPLEFFLRPTLPTIFPGPLKVRESIRRRNNIAFVETTGIGYVRKKRWIDRLCGPLS
ncbi:hypothetical protein IWX50DRAFT_402455 [Phyllosticta citricarpa]|uniref:Secreted protein n=1 Tax=Phyllosticta citricarpa TaxID=55181 RepID=A0ABR1MQ09_9PEZI